jgi:hypothetical protein
MLRSKDQVEFVVHAVILSVASPIFKDLMSVGSGERVVSLTEDAQTIRLMLAHLYHHEIPPIDSFDLLHKALEVARKYEIESMTAWLRSLFWLETSPMHMRHAPLETYETASVYGFEDVREGCYAYCVRKLDLRDEACMGAFVSSRRDPQSALALVVQLARRRAIITETLNNLHEYPMNLRAEEWDKTHLDRQTLAEWLICDKCRPAYDDVYFSPVSWQSFWAYRALGVLLREPLDRCDRVFKIGFLCKPYDHDADTATFCEKCFEQLQLRHHATWEDWAGFVQYSLGERLGEKV